MAVLGAERAVGQLLSVLETYMPTELAAIRTERGDSIVTPDPGGWLNARGGKMFADEVQVNCWCESISFDDWERTASSGWLGNTDGSIPASYECVIRVSHANRHAIEIDTMQIRSQRYHAAVLRALLRHHDVLLTNGAAFLRMGEARFMPEEIADNERSYSVVEQTVFLTVTEGRDGEGVAGGGTAPTYVSHRVRS